MASPEFTVTTDCGVAFHVSYGTVYPLTPCCQASGKGTEDGVCCRACYDLVSDLYGSAEPTNDPRRTESMITHLVSEEGNDGRGCTDAKVCAAATASKISDRLAAAT